MKLSITLAAAMLAVSASANTSVEWSTLGNVTGENGRPAYTQRFTVKGDTDFARLAFNQFARRMSTVNPLDTLIEIVPGYYAVASPRFAAAKGDTVCVDIVTSATFNNICYSVDGVHIVKADGTTAPVVFTRADLLASPDLYSTATNDRMPYGEEVFTLNEARSVPATTGAYDIVPSFKKVTETGKTLRVPEYIYEFKPTADKRPDYFRATVDGNKVKVETNNPVVARQRLARVLVPGKPVPSAVIEDWPDFGYRGLMIDIARNYQTPAEMRRIIDLMERYGLNVLHFHVADDEAWRLEIPGMPELTDLGSRRGYTLDGADFLPQIFAGNGNPDATGNSANGYFTRRDFVDLLRYAGERGIRIIPEIESPGHARAAILAMENRMRRTGDDTYRLIDPADSSKYTSAQAFHDNVMNPAIPGPVRFMTHVGAEIQKMYADAGVELPAIHIGGDEVAKGAWTGSPIAQEYMARRGMTNERDLHLIYIRELLDQYDRMGIPISGWQEIAVGHSDDFNTRVRPSVYSVNCWSTLGPQNSVSAQSAHAGYPTVLSNVEHYYLDMCYNYHPYERGLTWGGTVDEFKALNGYPRLLCRVDENDFKNVIGLSGQVFSETIRTPEMLETFLLPKMLGLAERAWNADSTYTDAEFSDVINVREIPAWIEGGYDFHVAQPGISVRDGKVHMNSQYDGSLAGHTDELYIVYTTDGTEPGPSSKRYKEPFADPGTQIRAKVYLHGKPSLTTLSRR